MVVSQSPLHRGSMNKHTLSVEVRKAPAMPAPEGEACPGVGLLEEQQSVGGGLHLLGRDAETQCSSPCGVGSKHQLFLSSEELCTVTEVELRNCGIRL